MAITPPYSTRFLAASIAVSPAAPSVSYVVPFGKVAIISDATATKDLTTPASDFLFSILPTGSGTAIYWWYSNMTSTTALQSDHWVGHVVANAGDTIIASRRATTASGKITVSGYLLTG